VQLTGNSTSTVGFWARYRLAAAQARARLVAAAAEAWGVPAEEVEISSGVVSHRSGKRAGFGDLAVRVARLPARDGVQPKDTSYARSDDHPKPSNSPGRTRAHRTRRNTVS